MSSIVGAIFTSILTALFLFAYKYPERYRGRARKPVVFVFMTIAIISFFIAGIPSLKPPFNYAVAVTFWGSAIFTAYAYILPFIVAPFLQQEKGTTKDKDNQ